ncbi:MAG TPA: hypothetical protein PKE26_08695 [Kiritimatiellia bacterium]|nr:hypothetical protein [Kiritimatiellia bacterium]HMO99173.1 hypothetical protein [Kiritimatiellia bacterium]HMP95760.1 hypothetical protein [Kiritimatiellia bacterium]
MQHQTTREHDDVTGPEPRTDFKGRSLGLYHPNSRGAGSALRLEPRVNRDDSERYNCFFLEMAAQKTPARRDSNGVVPATFDWANKITVKLGFLDVAELIAVLEGRLPRAGGERNGIYHATGSGNTVIAFVRNEENGSFYLALSAKRHGADAVRKVGITLSPVEAAGLRCLLQTGLFFVTFSSWQREQSLPGAARRERSVAIAA